MIELLDLVGLAVFAVSGALAAAEKRLDILGFVLFATITGIGGGTLRDVLLDTQIFWIADPVPVWICIGSAVATWFFARSFHSLRLALLWMDALGLAVFSVIGASKALSLGVPEVVAVGMGMMTASFGSLIRDTLLQRPVVLLEPDLYVTAALLGAVTYVGLVSFDLDGNVAVWVAVLTAFVLRAAAIQFGLRLRKFEDG